VTPRAAPGHVRTYGGGVSVLVLPSPLLPVVAYEPLRAALASGRDDVRRSRPVGRERD